MTSSCNIYSGSIISSGTINTLSTGYYGNNTITISPYSSFNYIPSKIIYEVMGEKIEIEGNYTFEVASLLSSITVNGWKYYEEMLKNGLILTGDLKNNLERMYLQNLRDQKIKDILEQSQ